MPVFTAAPRLRGQCAMYKAIVHAAVLRQLPPGEIGPLTVCMVGLFLVEGPPANRLVGIK